VDARADILWLTNTCTCTVCFVVSPAPSVDRLESGPGGGVHHGMSPMVGPTPVGKHFATYPQIEREMIVDQV
jgi:hypothetical protein